MSTTTLRIDASLRERIARLALALDQTPHGFMLEALAQKADEAEWRLGVQREAQHETLPCRRANPGWSGMK